MINIADDAKVSLLKAHEQELVIVIQTFINCIYSKFILLLFLVLKGG